MNEQAPLPFDGTPTPEETQPINISEIAEHIARNARPVEYEDRTSEAARDQGWGHEDISDIPDDTLEIVDTPEEVAASARRHPANDLDRAQGVPTPAQVQAEARKKGATDEDIDELNQIYKDNVRNIRDQLKPKN